MKKCKRNRSEIKYIDTIPLQNRFSLLRTEDLSTNFWRPDLAIRDFSKPYKIAEHTGRGSALSVATALGTAHWAEAGGWPAVRGRRWGFGDAARERERREGEREFASSFFFSIFFL